MERVVIELVLLIAVQDSSTVNVLIFVMPLMRNARQEETMGVNLALLMLAVTEEGSSTVIGSTVKV